MSLDLSIYLPDRPTAEQFREVVTAGAGLDVEGLDDSGANIVHGARRTHGFTVDGPHGLEPEDVPSEVTALVLNARWLYRVSVPATPSAAGTRATGFARRMTRAFDGAWVDEQSGDVTARRGLRRAARPEKDTRVSELELRFMVLREQLGDPVDVLLRAARRHLPEALPRRFGVIEPLAHRFDDVGEAGLREVWQGLRPHDPLFLKGTHPVETMSWHPPTSTAAGRAAPAGDKWICTVTIVGHALEEPGWREAVRGFVLEVADALPAYVARAELLPDQIWSGASLWSDGRSEHPVPLSTADAPWLGFPRTPAWLTWFGAPFAELVPRLPPHQLTHGRNGVLYASAEDPADATPLTGLLRDGWFSTVLDKKVNGIWRSWPPRMKPAKRIPTALRGGGAR